MPSPYEGANVIVRYTGWLADGKQFDSGEDVGSRWARTKPFARGKRACSACGSAGSGGSSSRRHWDTALAARATHSTDSRARVRDGGHVGPVMNRRHFIGAVGASALTTPLLAQAANAQQPSDGFITDVEGIRVGHFTLSVARPAAP